MSKEEFLGNLQSLVDLGDGASVLIYFALKKENGEVVLKKADIEGDALPAMRNGFMQSLRDEIDSFAKDSERDVLDMSARDDRDNVIYRYDIDGEEPSFFASMREVMLSHEASYFDGNKKFNFGEDSFSEISYFVIEIGTTANKIVIYRNNYNINLLRQGRGKFYVCKSDERISQVKEDILKIDTQMDALMVSSDVFITNLSQLDKSKDFATIITKKAGNALSEIEQLQIVDSVEGLQERLEELPFARRLMSTMKNSPIKSMPAKDILHFVGKNKALKNVLKIENGKIKLPSKRAQNSFIRLLNDDFLHSELSKHDYEARAKNALR